MSLPAHHLELLSPARTADIGREAVLHGADAVYIGGPGFGARHNAGNPMTEIAELCSFAHRFGVRIFVTLNTILSDAELEPARRLAWECHDAGVDALIVQDMGLLELDLPPIQLHASTQCDIRTPEKARFLGDVGFSQVVLARELGLEQIRSIRGAVPADTVLEFFIHGALCVAYSGQCFISHAHSGRSANRGDCSQDCRMPYTVTDAKGAVIAYEQHVLSMKDNNQTANLAALVDAGIRSFKIEGRYKDAAYVKNITAHYRRELDAILESRPELARASSGHSRYRFIPAPDKTFNRGTTDYFVTGRKPDIGAFESPKFVGQPIGAVTRVHTDGFELESSDPALVLTNGDGLNYRYKREPIGIQANVVKPTGQPGHWHITPNEPMKELPGLSAGISVNRNSDHHWELALNRPSAERRIDVDLHLAESPDGFTLALADESGYRITASLAHAHTPARDAERAETAVKEHLARLGGTLFAPRTISIAWSRPWFIPASALNALRREAVATLEAARLGGWQRPVRKTGIQPVPTYPELNLSYLSNVYNHAARAFYARHGVQAIAPAYEAHEETGEVSLMITRHCVRFSFNLCPKQAKGIKGVQGQVRADPLYLHHGPDRYTLRFDCKPCEMHVVGRIKKPVLNSPPPSSVPLTAPLQFHRRRPD
ncbi:MAG: U32 family peptidase [Proteobacteria bacterium]|nr:U32 family peptidase [Pseudomonadota bacterium]HQR03330.1 U32 family peptidase [Rhodocyclaceae bacterium]